MPRALIDLRRRLDSALTLHRKARWTGLDVFQTVLLLSKRTRCPEPLSQTGGWRRQRTRPDRLMNVLEDAPNHSWFTRPRYLRAATVLSGNALDLPRLASAVLTGSAYLISF